MQINVWFCILLCIIVWAFTSCTSSRLQPDDPVGREAVATIAKLESEIESLDRRIEGIIRRAENIEGDVNTTLELFGLYTEYVSKLRTGIIEYKIRVGIEENQNEKVDTSTNGPNH